jgi:hypothetical protein
MEFHLFVISDSIGNKKFLIIPDDGSEEPNWDKTKKAIQYLKRAHSVDVDGRTLKLCSCCVPAINGCHTGVFINPVDTMDCAFGFDIDEE